MRWVVSVIIILFTTSFFTPKAHAIIFLPAIILIPIAKIVALLIGGFSLPALGLGALWSKLFRTSLKKTLVILSILLVLFAIALVIILKIQNPERPLF